MKTMKKLMMISAVLVILASGVSCSIQDMIADALSSGMGESFTGEDDPELVGDALPFALKLYDSILEQTPRHVNLLLATGSAYVMYANAWVQTPAEMLPLARQNEKQAMFARAKKLYLRGQTLVMRALEVKYPGFASELASDNPERMLARCGKTDVPFLYWSCAGLFAAYSTDPFDLELGHKLTRTVLLMQRALELDPAFNSGAIQDFFISYYGSMPAGMGGDEEKARDFFEAALAVSEGANPSPYLSYALSLSVKKQNREEFRKMLEKALAVDPDVNPGNRLAVIIAQRKARWYLEHIDDFFI